MGTLVVDGIETPAVRIEDNAYKLSDLWSGEKAPASIMALLEAGPDAMQKLAASVSEFTGDAHPIEGSFAPPVLAPAKLICIGNNYSEHVSEMNSKGIMKFPYSFMRPTTSLSAHEQDIALPEGVVDIDWEAELGVVMGSRVRGVSAAEALEAVAGYTVINDISARDWIKERPAVGTDWVMQKAWDDFQPTGPWIKPSLFVPNPQNLDISLTVNGVVKQSSNTKYMIFGVAAIIEHLSRIMTLEPGDIIATGTPSGVGFARTPPEFMKAGDVVKVTIQGLGELENRLVR
ncbi:fumarylacetoacetate hydrolase family protein [Pelagibacterium lacus]|uniref:fumarylacetoacetate hydrolase family protein n=1 Tax=Pelagibacterium lacus TaxID=2282655 RepID=UPI001FE3BF35|nr:fumarylacetoacetate hydrolase family protein [Pelagibacterium lacus]